MILLFSMMLEPKRVINALLELIKGLEIIVNVILLVHLDIIKILKEIIVLNVIAPATHVMDHFQKTVHHVKQREH